MATVLKAGNSTTGGSFTPDNTGILDIKTGTGSGTTAISIDASQNVTFTNSVIRSGTAVASTSGTSIDFTSLPTGLKRITVMLSGVSTSGTSLMQIQIGSGSVTTSGYLGTAGIYTTASTTAFTAGFGLDQTGATASIRHSLYTICLLGSNIYVGSGVFTYSNTPVVGQSSGSVTLSGAIDRVRITTVNGTDTFDAGSINILYE
jgi:hypothetical protein